VVSVSSSALGRLCAFFSVTSPSLSGHCAFIPVSPLRRARSAGLILRLGGGGGPTRHSGFGLGGSGLRWHFYEGLCDCHRLKLRFTPRAELETCP